MNSRSYLLIMSLVISAVLVGTLFVVNNRNVEAINQRRQPTPAPTATPGPPPPNPTTVPLAQPLVTQEQALEQLALYDSRMAVWSEPWSKDTLTLQPGRITIKAYPSCAAESAAYGWNEWYAPEIEADAGSVWQITIRGKVQLTGMPNPTRQDHETFPNGVTYVISQRTGSLLEIRSLQP